MARMDISLPLTPEHRNCHGTCVCFHRGRDVARIQYADASHDAATHALTYEHGYRDALIMASKRIRSLPTVHGPDIAISDEALSEREAVADFIDELAS
jgi:hypothetical protein